MSQTSGVYGWNCQQLQIVELPATSAPVHFLSLFLFEFMFLSFSLQSALRARFPRPASLCFSLSVSPPFWSVFQSVPARRPKRAKARASSPCSLSFIHSFFLSVSLSLSLFLVSLFLCLSLCRARPERAFLERISERERARVHRARSLSLSLSL